MKVVVTHLKAPWPEGTGVGSVLDLPDPAPAWAVGKFKPAEEDAEVTVEFVKPAPDVPEVAPTVPADQFAGIEAQAAEEKARAKSKKG